MKKIIFTIIGIIILIILAIGIFWRFTPKRTYTLSIPKFEDIESIKVSQNDQEIIIYNTLNISKILTIFENKTTTMESIQDTPSNVSNFIQVKLILKNKDEKTLFLYQRNNKYYLEQSYNGIYELTEAEYNIVLEYFSKD